MDNFIFGAQNVAYNIKITLISLFQHQMVWGFAIGFSASTIIHLFIIADRPKDIPQIIRKSAPESFAALAKRDKKGTYQMSYSGFQNEYNRVRVLFYSSLLIFLIIIAIALIRY